MSVSIESKNYFIKMGYYNFFKLRLKIAELASTDIYELYKILEKKSYINTTKEFFEDYNKKLNKISEKYKNTPNDSVLDFLYQSDCNGKLSPKKCKDLYNVIKNYNNNKIVYGQDIVDDKITFNDFKNLIKDCIKSNYPLKWH